jgi:hypothetical protein
VRTAEGSLATATETIASLRVKLEEARQESQTTAAALSNSAEAVKEWRRKAESESDAASAASAKLHALSVEHATLQELVREDATEKSLLRDALRLGAYRARVCCADMSMRLELAVHAHALIHVTTTAVAPAARCHGSLLSRCS